MRKIKWVDSYKDIPYKIRQENQLDSTLHGFYYKPTNTLYMIKGKSSQADVLHEKYHSIKKHVPHPRNAELFINSEINATMYAYKKIGQPKHILGKLKALYNDIVQNEYKVGHKKALSLINKALTRVNAPDSWKSDYIELKRQADKING